MSQRFLILLSAVFFTAMASLPLHAAEVPSRETAGAEEARFSESRKDDDERLEQPLIAEISDDTAREKRSDDAGPRFVVKDIEIKGNYSLSANELEAIAAPLLNREVTLAEIQDVADAMKKHYRSKGFVAAYVYVPPQEVEDGVLVLDVLEGRLGQIKYSGNRSMKPNILDKRMSLEPYAVLKQDALKRALGRLNSRGDMKARAVLAPGDTVGTTDVLVEIEEKLPYRLSLDVNNHGTENTGEYRYGISGAHTNVFGGLEELHANVQLGEGVTTWGAGYNFLILPDHGTRLGYAYSAVDVDVGGIFAALDVKGEAQTHRVYASQPVFANDLWEIEAAAGLDIKKVENRGLGAITGFDEHTIPNLEVIANESDDHGVTYLSNRFNWGIPDFLGSSPDINALASRAGSGGEFFSYRGSAQRIQRLSEDLFLWARSTWQLSPDAMTPSEQLGIGGARSVRGYQEGDYLADQGVYASMEIHFPAYFLPAVPRDKIQLFAFADAGYGELERTLVGESPEKDLAGAGVGCRLRITDKLQGKLEYGWVLGDRAFDNRSGTFYFSVSYDWF